MNKRTKIIIVTVFLLFSSFSYSQKPFHDTVIVGLRMGLFFNSGGFHPFFGYQTVVAPNLATFFKIDRHEFSIGLIFPAMIEAKKGNNYLREYTIGSLIGYTYYLFNPRHKSNLFLHYEFEYIYFSGRILEGSHTGYYEVDVIYKFIRNVFGLGFSQYFDRNKYFGISVGCDYIIPYFFERKNSNTQSLDWSTKWLDPHMNNYFNYYFNINIKLASFSKNKNKKL